MKLLSLGCLTKRHLAIDAVAVPLLVLSLAAVPALAQLGAGQQAVGHSAAPSPGAEA